MIRSKLNCQRLIKSNENDFKTFITLTFADHITSINDSNKLFQNWCKIIKKIIHRLNIKNNTNNDFKYVCVPEFQKKGRVHYHLLTNICFTDLNFINENYYMYLLKNRLLCRKHVLYKKRFFSSFINYKLNDFNICIRKYNNKYDNYKKTYNFKSKTSKYFKTIRYWNNGYSNVVSIENINIVGYLLKYMTKDIDNRLFARRRYFYSLNLKTPSEIYLNITDNTQDILLWLSKLNNSNVIYNNLYYDKFGQEINFFEYKI